MERSQLLENGDFNCAIHSHQEKGKPPSAQHRKKEKSEKTTEDENHKVLGGEGENTRPQRTLGLTNLVDRHQGGTPKKTTRKWAPRE